MVNVVPFDFKVVQFVSDDLLHFCENVQATIFFGTRNFEHSQREILAQRKIFPFWLQNIYIYIAIVALSGTIYTTAAMFLFRFFQTTQSRFISYLSDMRYYALCYVVFVLFVIATIIYPLTFQLQSTDYLRAAMKDVDPEAYKRMLTGNVNVGINVKTGNQIIYVVVSSLAFFTIVCLVILFSIIGCFKFLRVNRHKLRGRTARLYKSLLMMLVIDVCVAAVAGFFTITLCFVSVIGNYDWGSKIITISLAFGDAYPLFANLLVLVYVEPYRRPLVNFIRFHRLTKIQLENSSVMFTRTTHLPKRLSRALSLHPPIAQESKRWFGCLTKPKILVRSSDTYETSVFPKSVV
ncbi:hypothetical protein M3Y98_00573300 [Aphelenchoides besseyi]|nr:hypothetical protein M3Y98_00573300 [Aphelenchoides besseyi]KAI6193727.1 hypothetical protein M3Y96_01049600 [Aphelenchoides besseyi]